MKTDYADVAVLVPCYNEAQTVSKVVDDFHNVLPGATVYVYDNNSSDDTAAIAREHNAWVRHEPRQGKGNVVRQMLRDIDADYYIMVDGDDTYPAEYAPALLEPLFSGEADHVVGDRISNGTYGEENKRAFHGFGNNLVRWLIKRLYGFEFNDVMTGYRAFTRKPAPAVVPSGSHAMENGAGAQPVPDRPVGSVSKLNTFSDGAKVLGMIMSLAKDYRPMPFFNILAAISLVIGLCLGIPVIAEFNTTGLVPRFPTAILAAAFCILAVLFFIAGLILDTVVKGNRRQWELDVMRICDEETARKRQE